MVKLNQGVDREVVTRRRGGTVHLSVTFPSGSQRSSGIGTPVAPILTAYSGDNPWSEPRRQSSSTQTQIDPQVAKFETRHSKSVTRNSSVHQFFVTPSALLVNALLVAESQRLTRWPPGRQSTTSARERITRVHGYSGGSPPPSGLEPSRAGRIAASSEAEVGSSPATFSAYGLPSGGVDVRRHS